MGKAKPGWYKDPDDPKQLRRWDGQRWTDDRQPKRRPATMETPSDYIALGVVLMFVAGILVGLILAGDDENAGEWAIIVGGVVGGVAQILLLIGIIAKGVEVGNRTSAERTTASGA